MQSLTHKVYVRLQSSRDAWTEPNSTQFVLQSHKPDTPALRSIHLRRLARLF